MHVCTDGAEVEVLHVTFVQHGTDESEQSDREEADGYVAPRNGIAYRASGRDGPQLFVSGTQFNRSASLVVRGDADARTIVFPNTVRAVQSDAFYDNERLRSAVLNEGLEALGDHTFCGCVRLSRVTFPEGSSLGEI